MTSCLVFQFMVDKLLHGQIYSAPFHKWHANGRTQQSPLVRGRSGGFETKEKKKERKAEKVKHARKLEKMRRQVVLLLA